MNKTLNKAPRMPYNQFSDNTLIMFDDSRIVMIKVILDKSYTTDELTVGSQALDIIKTFGDNTDFYFKEKQMVIKKDKNTCKVNYIDKNIKFPELEVKGNIMVNRNDLTNALQFTSKTAGDRLSGINISNTGLVATNGYKAYFKGEQNEDTNVTISNDFVNLILKTFNDKEEIEIKFDDIRSWVEIDNITIVGSILISPYPKTNDLKTRKMDYTVINLDVNKIKEANNILKLDTENKYFDFLAEEKIIYCSTEDFKLEVGSCNENISKLPCFNKEILNAFSLLDNLEVTASAESDLKPLRLESGDRVIVAVPIRKG